MACPRNVGSRAQWHAPGTSRGRALESLNGAKGFTSRKPLALLGALKSHTLVCRICSNYSTAPASKFQKPICRFCEQLGPPRSQPSNSQMFRQMLLLRSTLLKQARRKYNLLQELIVTALRHTSRLKVVSRSLRRNLIRISLVAGRLGACLRANGLPATESHIHHQAPPIENTMSN